jgi:hypothetical protein
MQILNQLIRRPASAGFLVFGLVVLSACGGRHHLDRYDFAGRSVAVVYFGAPAPELRTGGYDVDTSDPISVLATAGGRVAREVEARQARGRLDTAARRLDLAPRMADRTLERASRYLGARPVTERGAADFLLEVDVLSMGLDARSERLQVFVTSEVVLLETRTGREIWSSRVRSWDPLSSDMVGGGALGDIIGAGILNQLKVEDFELVLGRLADYAADRVARELRNDLRGTRR